MLLENIIKVILPAVLSFIVGMVVAPKYIEFLRAKKVWKKKPGKKTLYGAVAEEFNKLKKDDEAKVPRMGGVIIWGSVLFSAAFLYLLSIVYPSEITQKLNFISRSQTWIPLFVMLAGGIVGLINDYLDSFSHGNGLSLKRRLAFVGVLSAFVGWWFYAKLGVDSISIPFDGLLYLGVLIIPFFMLLSFALYASGVIDGIDGLSAGVFVSIFAAYTGIALYQDQINIAAFSAAVLGGLLAFLWYNVYPARVYMTETGTMALTLTLATIAFMADSLGGGVGILVLPVIGFLLVATVASDILQITYKKLTGKKLFRIAPLHHHFEAKGVHSVTVVMRYWIVSIILAFVGFAIALLG